MNTRHSMAVGLLALLNLLPLNGWAQEKPTSAPAKEVQHLRPWEMRYFISVENTRGWAHAKRLAAEYNQKPKTRASFDWEQYFEATTVLSIPHWDLAKDPSKAKYPEDLAVVVIGFDKDGWVTTPHTYPQRLRGRNRSSVFTNVIELTDDITRRDGESSVADWFMGYDENTADGVTPALCISEHMPIETTAGDLDMYLYGRKYKTTSWYSRAPFGCREWSYQMQDDERAYIDVTSYVPKEPQYGYPHGSYILPFIGWSRFDRHKPVIGKHANTWYCLYECPKGDAPGPIEDIAAWAHANGWPLPKPPTRMPVFPDDPRRRGRYP